MARYIRFIGGNGYCGCDIDEVEVFPDDTTDKELDQCADDMAMENGESFEDVATGWDRDFESEEEREDYYDGCYCSWHEISEEDYKEMKGEN